MQLGNHKREVPCVIAFALAILLLVGCLAENRNSAITYTGTIVRVVDSDAVHHFVQEGQQPVRFVYLSNVTSARAEAATVRIGFVGLVDRATLGRPGDTATFTLRGPFPFNREIWAADLERYVVTPGC